MSEHFEKSCKNIKRKLNSFYLNQDDSLLLVIDIQDKLAKAIHNEEEIKLNAKRLVEAASLFSMPIIFTEQYPKGLGPTNDVLMTSAKDPHVIEKNSFTAFGGELEEKLKECGKRNIIVVGMETHICVFQTIRDLKTAGYNVTLAADASGSRTKYNHETGVQAMRDMKTVIANTEMILFNLLKTSKDKNFKAVQGLIK